MSAGRADNVTRRLARRDTQMKSPGSCARMISMIFRTTASADVGVRSFADFDHLPRDAADVLFQPLK